MSTDTGTGYHREGESVSRHRGTGYHREGQSVSRHRYRIPKGGSECNKMGVGLGGCGCGIGST